MEMLHPTLPEAEEQYRKGAWGRLGNWSAPQRIKMATENQLVTTAIDLAHILGWTKVAHFRPAKTAQGYRTPVEGDGAGFPDLVLVRERVVWIEAKVKGRKLSPEQESWMVDLIATGAEFHLIQLDREWDFLVEVLTRRTRY